MAKVFGKIIKRDIAALRGKVDLYYHKDYGWLARAWPSYSNRNRSPGFIASQNRMKSQTAELAKLDTADIDGWRDLAQGASMTWKDALVKRLLTAPDDEFLIIRVRNAVAQRLPNDVVEIQLQKNPEDVGTARDSFLTYRANFYSPFERTVLVDNFPGQPNIVFQVLIPPGPEEIVFVLFGNKRVV